jgi:hypothetical protein
MHNTQTAVSPHQLDIGHVFIWPYLLGTAHTTPTKIFTIPPETPCISLYIPSYQYLLLLLKHPVCLCIFHLTNIYYSSWNTLYISVYSILPIFTTPPETPCISLYIPSYQYLLLLLKHPVHLCIFNLTNTRCWAKSFPFDEKCKFLTFSSRNILHLPAAFVQIFASAFTSQRLLIVFLYYHKTPRSDMHKIKWPHPWASFSSTPRRRVGKWR